MPLARHYAFEYAVVIQNLGSVSAQLLSSHWIITDAKGSTEEVHGVGVVGEHPILHPGQSFEYKSTVVLRTSRGEMRGSYLMHSVLGRTFEVEAAPFLLTLPQSLN